ncbi:MAG: hypothetical protein E7342_00200 [Clostridiales bacterium]|nr:hypothetical protein [Clostridiales bacterium]
MTKSVEFKEKIVEEVTNDFLKRREERLSLEKQWELNLKFLEGKQYYSLLSNGKIIEKEKNFGYEKREVYNHILPIIERRLAKFSQIKPIFSVRPTSDEEAEIKNAKVAEKVLLSTFNKLEVEKTVLQATKWSETLGTAFYKVVWMVDGGKQIGKTEEKEIFEGEVKISAISPFEIFPDSLTHQEVEDCFSIIHAKAMRILDVEKLYGKKLDDIKLFFDEEENYVTVIEKYEKPTKEYPLGRLITVAGDKLLFYGELPYENGEEKQRNFPFIKQTSGIIPGSFFGSSIIERLIPIQRAFNAIKNRKHEFLNRISTGIMTVEDGAIDTDDLETEGLMPGKVLVYRQGMSAPSMLKEEPIPTEFSLEEERLLTEFISISGVNDVISSALSPKVTSATALEVLSRQENEKLFLEAENVRGCYLMIAKMILRIYRQFIKGVRIMKEVETEAENKIFYVDKKVMQSDDVYIDNENEMLFTQSQKKEMLFKLYESGLLENSQGKLSSITKEKILNLLGYKNLFEEKNLLNLHQQKADSENQKLKKEIVEVDLIDDDEIHLSEHTKYILCEYENLTKEERERVFYHIEKHKEKNQKKENEYARNKED